jgi:CRISPR-associated endonuclease Csn1
MAYRLGLDLGPSSIGWAALTLDETGVPCGVLDLGVRIFSDGRHPKDGTSLAAQRRGPRGMRRNRDRYLQRRKALLNALTRAGLMPADESARTAVARLDPWSLRAAALQRALRPEELGRALFHLNQHRGFRSNRKTDLGNKQGRLIDAAARDTAHLMHQTGHQTIGEWLAARHAERLPVRVRLEGSGKNARYEFYPQRAMVEAEFDLMWAAQAEFNAALSDELRAELRRIIFHQRPLKPAVVGKCWLEPGEDRAPRGLPTTQRFRIAQTVSHLRVSQPGLPERRLTAKERNALLAVLYLGRDQKLTTLAKKLGLPPETDFNYRDDVLVGCRVAAKLGSKACLGPEWHDLTLAQQDAVARALLDAEDDETAIAALQALGLSQDMAERAANAALPDGHAALAYRALAKILPFLEDGETYNRAVQLAGYEHHSDRRTGEERNRLPYYGEVLSARIGTGTGALDDSDEKRLGKAPNPTVHVALNQLRHVVNAVIEQHGLPAEIVVKTSREVGRSAEQRRAYEEQQRTRRADNDRRRAEILSLGFKVTRDSLMRMRLLDEQADDPKQRCCPYSGQFISPRLALSDAIEMDYILPFSLSLDDSAANRVLTTREANRRKANRTPHQAFANTEDWPDILKRVALLPDTKRWRFAPDAMAKLAQDYILHRYLTDTSTIARWAVEYLSIIAPENVWGIPGRLSSLLRYELGLHSLSARTDHRHHAIDGVVAALTDRAMLQRVARAAKASEDLGLGLSLQMDEPWDNFVADVTDKLAAVTVSIKADTGWQGALHNDSNYGLIHGAAPAEHNVVIRRPILTLAAWAPDEAREGVRDPVLAAKIAEVLEDATPGERKSRLAALVHSGGYRVRRVRTTEKVKVRAIKDQKSGQPYRAVKLDGNHRFEVWRRPSGELETCIVTTFDAAQAAEAARLGRPAPKQTRHPASKLILQAHKNDMLAFGHGDRRRILRVVKMSGNLLVLADHHESGSLQERNGDNSDPFKYVSASVRRLVREQARKVFVRPDGRILDPGSVF